MTRMGDLQFPIAAILAAAALLAASRVATNAAALPAKRMIRTEHIHPPIAGAPAVYRTGLALLTLPFRIAAKRYTAPTIAVVGVRILCTRVKILPDAQVITSPIAAPLSHTLIAQPDKRVLCGPLPNRVNVYVMNALNCQENIKMAVGTRRTVRALMEIATRIVPRRARRENIMKFAR